MVHSLRRKVFGVFVVSLFVGLLSCCLYACGPQVSSEESSKEGASESGTTMAIQWSPEVECGVCHATEADSAKETVCEAFLNEDSCMVCHDEVSILSTVHEGVAVSDRAPTRLKKTAVSEQACLSCHEQGLESLAEKLLVDENGTSVNPHALPQVASHEEILCGDCHKMHSAPSERVKNAGKLCQSCHHANVYECYTCHDHG